MRALLTRKFSDLPGAIDQLANQFNASLSRDNVESIATAMSLLSTRVGTLLLAGHGTPFPDLTVDQRQAVLQKWRTSSLPLLRKIFRGVVCELFPRQWSRCSDLIVFLDTPAIALYVAYNVYDDNLLATGFPASGDPLRYADPERQRKHYPYEFETISTPLQVFETDMLVVGSGAGGGVVVSELAKKGWQTIVVEKGQYVKPEEMLGTPRDGFERMYESQGLMATEDGSMNVLAGSTFGGGTTGETLSILVCSVKVLSLTQTLCACSELVRVAPTSAFPSRAVGERSRPAVLPLERVCRFDRVRLWSHGCVR